jgi:hypothetical protein
LVWWLGKRTWHQVVKDKELYITRPSSLCLYFILPVLLLLLLQLQYPTFWLALLWFANKSKSLSILLSEQTIKLSTSLISKL